MQTVTPLASSTITLARSPRAGAQARGLALVVEDNPVNQLLAEEMLKRLGFEVTLAADGVEALEACQRRTPDVVLMDVQMPRMDGFGATRQLRLLQQAGLLQRFPIIGVTACGASRQECLDAGMDGFIAKPLSMACIEEQLRTVAH
jgi:hypothetical protein